MGDLSAVAIARQVGERQEDRDTGASEGAQAFREGVVVETDSEKASSLSPALSSAGAEECRSDLRSLPDDLFVDILQSVVNEAGNCSKAVAECVTVCRWFSALVRQIPSLSFSEEPIVTAAAAAPAAANVGLNALAVVDGSGDVVDDGDDFMGDVAMTVFNMESLRALRISESGSHPPRIFGHSMLEQILCHVGESLEELVLGGSASSPVHVAFFPIAVVVRHCPRLRKLSLSAANLYVEGVALGEEVTRMALSSNGVRTDRWEEYSRSDSLMSLVGRRVRRNNPSATLKHLELSGMLCDIGFENPDRPLPCFQVLFSLFPNLETLSVSFSRHVTVGIACVEVTTLPRLRSLKISAPRPSPVRGGGMGFAFLASLLLEGAPLLSTVEIDGVYSLSIKGKSKIERLVMEAVPDIDVEGGPRVVLGDNVTVQSLVLSGMKTREGGSCLCRAFDQEYGWTWERLRDLLASKVLSASGTSTTSRNTASSRDYGGGGGSFGSPSPSPSASPSACPAARSSGGLQTLVLRDLPICASAPAVLPVARAELVDALILTGGDLNFASHATSTLSISRSLKTLRRLELHGFSLISFLIRRLPPQPSPSSFSSSSAPGLREWGPPPLPSDTAGAAAAAEAAAAADGGAGGSEGADGGYLREDRLGGSAGGYSMVFDRDAHREVTFRAPFMTSALFDVEGSDALLRWVGPRLVPFLAEILIGCPMLTDLTVRINQSKATMKSTPTIFDWEATAGINGRAAGDGPLPSAERQTGLDILLQGVNRLKHKYGDKVLRVVQLDAVKPKETVGV